MYNQQANNNINENDEINEDNQINEINEYNNQFNNDNQKNDELQRQLNENNEFNPIPADLEFPNDNQNGGDSETMPNNKSIMNEGGSVEDQINNLAVYNALNNSYLAYRMNKIDRALKNAQHYDEDNLQKIHKHKNKKIYSKDDTDDDDVFNITHSEDEIKRAVVKYYYKKIIDKWIYKDPDFRSLLQYVKIDNGKCNISINNKDNAFNVKYKHLSDEDKKLFNKKLDYMKSSILDKENVKLILVKIKDKNNVSWYALNKKVNKPTIKHAIYKAFLKKIKKMSN